jgi:hypothetical protein
MTIPAAPSPYLTPAELRGLTGCGWRARQAAWLKANDWPHEINQKGHILVLREYYLARFSGLDARRPTVHAHQSHNFAACT